VKQNGAFLSLPHVTATYTICRVIIIIIIMIIINSSIKL